MTNPVLWFGRHKGQPLPEVPTGYLGWALANAKLSSGIRVAVVAELQRRGLTPPPAPPPTGPWLGPCPRCRCRVVCYRWHEHSNGLRQVRASCSWCHAALGIAPRIEPYVSHADRAASAAPVLDLLIGLDELGLEVQSDGKRAWLSWEDQQRVPPVLLDRLRECQHSLARLLGRTTT